MAAERPPERPESHWRNLRGPETHFRIGEALKAKLDDVRHHIRATKAGLSLIETKKWQPNQAERDSVGTAPPDPERFTVEVHGGPDGVHLGGHPISARELADIVRAAPGYEDGEPVRLLSCRTGAETADGGPNFAQQLSSELGVEVLAPNTDAWVDDYGNMYASRDRATFDTDSSGVPQPSWNEPGQWISFGPDGERSVHDSPHPPGHEPRWDREGHLGTASRRGLGGFFRRMFGGNSANRQHSFDPDQDLPPEQRRARERERAAQQSVPQGWGPPRNSGPPPQQGGRPAQGHPPQAQRPPAPPPPTNTTPPNTGGHMPPSTGGNPRPDGGFGPPGSDASGAWQHGSASPGPRPDGGFGPPGSQDFEEAGRPWASPGGGSSHGNTPSWRGNRRPNSWDDSGWDDDFEPSWERAAPRRENSEDEARSDAPGDTGHDSRQSSTPEPSGPDPPRHDGPGDGGSPGGGSDAGPSVGDLIPHDPAGFDEARVKARVKSVVEGQYAGLHVDVHTVSGSENMLAVTADITDENGHHVGSTIRYLQREGRTGDLAVHHETLSLNKDVQGQGFAQKFDGAMEQWYRDSGVDRITLRANIDVGSYAWARNGYDFAMPQQVVEKIRPRLVGEIARSERELGELRRRREATPEGGRSAPTPDERRLENSIATAREFVGGIDGTPPRIPDARAIADLGRPHESDGADTRGETWLASGSCWTRLVSFTGTG